LLHESSMYNEIKRFYPQPKKKAIPAFSMSGLPTK
jgi:hypothetical protein